jgi:hypothetical protein
MVAKLSKKTSAQILLEYCRDINEWPNRWTIVHTDIQVGKDINEYFKLFLIDRINKARTKSTIKIYARYLWALGGELIRLFNDENHKQRLSSKDFLLKHIGNSGGPSWGQARDGFALARFDSVCKQLFKFIISSEITD